jgi:DUF4097 and DUF4098 domain-containing protein YvlB
VGGALKLYSRHGNVEVKDVAQATTLTVEHGTLRVQRVGPLEATLAYSDLTADAVRGELTVRGRHAGVKAGDVSGRAVIETSYRDVELRGLSGDARVKAEHGGLKASSLKGALEAEISYDDAVARDVAGRVEARVSHGGFRGEGLAQGARIWSSGDDVVLSGFEGPVEVEAQRGGVRLLPGKPLRDTIAVTTSRGAILLAVPPGSSFLLDASASRGEVQLDVKDAEVSEASASRVKARLGEGGKNVTLRTQHGDIAVEARAASASTR